MNERRKWTTVLMTITIFVITAAFLPGLVRAGNPEPPTDPPGPTMHTLEEIYNIVRDTNSKVGQCEGAPVPKTGQTTSYSAGDDGDLEKGVAWPDPRFTDHSDGTVTDNLTGLMWTRNANIYGQSNWNEALSDCASCTEGGHDDWRLPNVRELHSLVDYSQCGPALPAGHPFTKVQSAYYWSSSALASSADFAWGLYLSAGYVHNDYTVHDYYVWCVRGG